MSSNISIRILHSSQLDKKRWDDCVRPDENSLIYTRSSYLDVMADDWYGLIVGDYEAILALPVKKKYGIRMVALPAFVQRLDVVGRYNKSLFPEIEKIIVQTFRLVQFASSEENLFQQGDKRIRTNFMLPLAKTYHTLLDNYTTQCRKNIRKACNRGCMLTNQISINDVILFYQQAYGKLAGYTDEHFFRLKKLLAVLPTESYHLAGVQDEKGVLVFAGLLLDDGKRLYYILGAPTAEGRQMRATYFFIDAMIQKFAGSEKVFDFEGSDIPEVANFYRSFSPDTEYYFQYYINNYPFPLKLIINHKIKPF